MEYGLTVNVQNKIKDLKLEKSENPDYRFCWEINLTKVENRNVLVIVHPTSRYCMIYANMKPSVWKDFSAFVTDAIKSAFIREGLNEKDFERYIELAGDVRFTKTHGKQAVGGLNHITGDLYVFGDWLVKSELLQERITQCFNTAPTVSALHPEYRCITPQDFLVNEMRNLLYGEDMMLRYAILSDGITIRDGKPEDETARRSMFIR